MTSCALAWRPVNPLARQSHVAVAPTILLIVVQASSLLRLEQAGSLHHNMGSQNDRCHLRFS
jgi:hypothetical protein